MAQQNNNNMQAIGGSSNNIATGRSHRQLPNQQVGGVLMTQDSLIDMNAVSAAFKTSNDNAAAGNGNILSDNEGNNNDRRVWWIELENQGI